MRAASLFLAALVCGLVVSACSQEPASTPDPSPQPQAPEPAAVKVEMLPRAQVEEAFSRWLAAQNEGNFEAYSASYATRFFGIKRSGARVYQYDREGWLVDRKRMFRKPVTVQADEVKVASSRSTAQLSFIQTWSSGSYSDVGPKQLVFVREGEGLRISREEMLSSKVLREGGAPVEGPARAGFAFVDKLGDEHWVLLDEGVDESLELGPPVFVSASPAVAHRAVGSQGLSPELAGVVGRSVTLYSEAGPVCRGTLRELKVLSRFWAHWAMPDFWAAENASVEEQAQEIVSMGPGYLAARFEPAGAESCEGARWARGSTLPAATTYVSEDALARSLQPRLLDELRGLQGFQAIQAVYDREEDVEEPRPGSWDGVESCRADDEFRAFRDPKTGRTFVTASLSSGCGCGGFYGEFWAAWELLADERLRLITDPGEPGPLFQAEAAFDLDGDGQPELIERHRLLQPVGGSYGVTVDFDLRSFDCSC